MKRMLVALVLPLAVGTGCKKTTKSSLPPAICKTAKSWQPGTQAFQEASASWGLDKINATGLRLSVADIDNDGWPDLIVRTVGVVPDQGPSGGARSIWLLRNTGQHSFEDVTYSSGIIQTRNTHTPAVGRPGETVVFADVDNDGDLDAYQGLDTSDPTASLGETSEIMLNDGHGHFTLGPAKNELRLAFNVDNPGGAAFTDFDLDGKVDLWVPQFDYTASDGSDVMLQNQLYHGNGDGTFTNWVNQAAVDTCDWEADNYTLMNEAMCDTRSWSATSCDLNGDGYPELMAASYGRSPNQLWQAVPGPSGVTFTNQSLASGYAYDNDFNWSDNQFADCYCQQTPTDPECDGGLPAPEIDCSTPNWDPVTGPMKFQLGGNNAATVCADIGNDGNFDLVNTDIKHWWAGQSSDEAEILVNQGGAPGADVQLSRPGRDSMGIVVPHDDISWDEGIMTAAMIDFDNDGWLDMFWGASDYPSNRALLYHQKSKLQFESVPTSQGIDLNRANGVVVADFDRDGDLDMIVATSTNRCSGDTDTPCYPDPYVRFFENVIGQNGNWIQLSLEGGPGTNRSAVGALVTVTAGGVTQSKQVEGGHGGFGMEDDLVQHFGLGEACEADVTIRWPNVKQETQTFTVPSGYRFKVTEGSDPVVLGLGQG